MIHIHSLSGNYVCKFRPYCRLRKILSQVWHRLNGRHQSSSDHHRFTAVLMAAWNQLLVVASRPEHSGCDLITQRQHQNIIYNACGTFERNGTAHSQWRTACTMSNLMPNVPSRCALHYRHGTKYGEIRRITADLIIIYVLQCSRLSAV